MNNSMPDPSQAAWDILAGSMSRSRPLRDYLTEDGLIAAIKRMEQVPVPDRLMADVLGVNPVWIRAMFLDQEGHPFSLISFRGESDASVEQRVTDCIAEGMWCPRGPWTRIPEMDEVL